MMVLRHSVRLLFWRIFFHVFFMGWVWVGCASGLAAGRFELGFQPLLPEITARPVFTRVGGIASVVGDSQMLYAGDHLYFFSSVPSDHIPRYKIGGLIGAHFGFLNQKTAHISQDSYGGLVSELSFDSWGMGLEVAYFSSYIWEGLFRSQPIRRVSHWGISLRGMYFPSFKLAVEMEMHLFVRDEPRQRVLAVRPSIMWLPWAFLKFEVYGEAGVLPISFEMVRIKLSYCLPGEGPRLIPYVLFHTGAHYITQRSLDRITQVQVGVEVRI